MTLQAFEQRALLIIYGACLPLAFVVGLSFHF